MRITVRGWGRDLGETEILNKSLSDAETIADGQSFSRGNLYKKILYPDDRRRTRFRVSASAEVRLGGTYLLHLELRRNEIAEMFYATHSGSMMRMLRSFIEAEDNADRAKELERHRETLAWMEKKYGPADENAPDAT
ncbi:MAG: hypothetical protein IT536_08300 [Hyphomicrobiales bacterium]|nr:hypothetical protein [Hyphomicrobiales bacterium]